MERAQQRRPARRTRHLHAVAELRPRPHAELAARRLVGERRRGTRPRARRAAAPARAAGTGGTRRARRAAACCRAARTSPPPSPTRPSSVSPSSTRHRRRLVGQPGAVHRPEQPVARAVAGEHPAGAVGAVCGRRQAEHQDARRRGRRTRGSAGPSTSRRGRRPASRPPPARATRPAAGRPAVARRPSTAAGRANPRQAQ